jgi:hypothetical protein
MRLSTTLRALALVPLLGGAVDQTRAVVLCGSGAQDCLEASGRGWLGAWGIALVAAYTIALALLVARGARPGSRSSFARLWLVGTAGVAAACAGQALIAHALGGAPLGGGWLGLLALCAVAGAVIALALRTAPELPHAPRPATRSNPLRITPAPQLLRRGFATARQPRGRAPPLTV